jgi:hypothetical protein
MNIQATKIELVKMILGIENPQIIERIKSLVKNETTDFWDELTSEQQKEMNRAIKELDNGGGVDWNDFKRSME